MKKFNLFSASALAAMMAPRAGDPEDQDAGPAPAANPDDAEPATTGDADEGEDTTTDKPGDTPGEGNGKAKPAAEDGAVDVVAVSTATAVAQAKFAEGMKAERARTAAVLGSAAGKKNPGMAAWMLENAPEATADSIIAKLDSAPAAAGHSIEDTDIDLGGAPSADADAAESDAVDAMFKASQDRLAAQMGMGGGAAAPAAQISPAGTVILPTGH